MEIEIYLWIGRLAVWLCFGFLIFKLIGYVLENLINWMGKRWNNMWAFIEYLYYRKDFKEWIKDKERHPKMDKH